MLLIYIFKSGFTVWDKYIHQKWVLGCCEMPSELCLHHIKQEEIKISPQTSGGIQSFVRKEKALFFSMKMNMLPLCSTQDRDIAWQEKCMRFIRDCDCCLKELGTQMPSAVWDPFRAGRLGVRLVGIDQLYSEFCILYGSLPSSEQSHWICHQTIVLHETVNPHFRLTVVFCWLR